MTKDKKLVINKSTLYTFVRPKSYLVPDGWVEWSKKFEKSLSPARLAELKIQKAKAVARTKEVLNKLTAVQDAKEEKEVSQKEEVKKSPSPPKSSKQNDVQE